MINLTFFTYTLQVLHIHYILVIFVLSMSIKLHYNITRVVELQ